MFHYEERRMDGIDGGTEMKFLMSNVHICSTVDCMLASSLHRLWYSCCDLLVQGRPQLIASV